MAPLFEQNRGNHGGFAPTQSVYLPKWDASDTKVYEAFYQAHQEVNTWPLNRKVLVEIWATQTFMGSQVIAT
ncbi:MAG: hypothetical protein ACO34J_17035, partial [Prochlorothrix sp.]